jgi:hypothetical protein
MADCLSKDVRRFLAHHSTRLFDYLLSLTLMCNVVPLDFEQQAAIADLEQSGSLTAIPAGVPKSALNRFDLSPGPKRSQREDISIFGGRCSAWVYRRFRLL